MALILSCQREGNNWVEKDLMSEGLPIKIKAPEDLEVKKANFGGSQEYDLKSNSDYYQLSVMVNDATTSDESMISRQLMKLISEGKYFDEIVMENPDGFIYRLSPDSTRQVYGFRRVHIQGGKMYIFQSPIISRLNQAQAKAIYEAVAQK